MQINTVALYARVSTKDQGQDTENQLRELRAYCERSDYTIYKEYVDKESGRSSERKAFTHMMEDARHKKFDLLLFWSLDRLTREGVLPTLTYLQKLDDAGVAYRSHTEQYIDSAGTFRDAIISILASLAKQEAVRRGERVKAGLERAKAEGKKLGASPLSDTKVKRIQKLARDGKGKKTVARELGISLNTVKKYWM